MRQTFAKLTDDDIARLSGKMEEFSGVLQKKYGYNKAKAAGEIDNWLKEADKKLHTKAYPPASVAGRQWNSLMRRMALCVAGPFCINAFRPLSYLTGRRA